MSEIKKRIRNEHGLIEGIHYPLAEDGFSIDWRKLINPKFITPNKQNFERKNQPLPETIDGLDDGDLLILLQGFKELAWLRGYESYNYLPVSPSNDMVIVVCSFNWLPNIETEGRKIHTSALGDATPFNTTGFGKIFLSPIAENRAFVRCVRNFLRIPILGQDELPPTKSEVSSQPVSNNLLENLMAQHKITWEQVKNSLLKDKFEGAEKFEKVSDIPRAQQLSLIAKIKAKFENK